MQLPDDVVAELRRRLARAEGQLRGVQGMLAEGRDCREVLAQLSAARNALEQVGFKLVASGLTYCLEHPEEAARSGYALDDVQRMFMKLA
jgi:DNA-binding FrmR family transcriptional regulator